MSDLVDLKWAAPLLDACPGSVVSSREERAVSDVRVAFDLGAESGRAHRRPLRRRRGSTSTEARRFPNRPVRLPDGLYWDVLGLFGEICSALGELAGGSDRVRSVGIDSWGCDFGLLDRQGALISNPLHHRDGRGAGAMEKAFARVPAEEIYETTGIQFLPFNTLFQLLALEQSVALRSAETFLLIPDLLGLLADRRARRRGHEREHDAAPRCRDRRLVGQPDSSGSGSPSGSSRTCASPARPSAACFPTSPTGAGLPVGTPVSRSPPTTPRRRSSPSRSSPGRRAAYISSGTWSLVGVELAAPFVSERGARREPDERARLRRHDPAAEERDGPLARPGMPAGLGGRRRDDELRGSGRARAHAPPGGAALRSRRPRAAGSGEHARRASVPPASNAASWAPTSARC